MFNSILNFIFELIINWTPWISFWYDVWFVQFVMFYILYLIFITLNVYYVLLYLFIEVFFFGIFISIYQMELFTGFLWVVEATIIFIMLILFFYLNIDGVQPKIDLKFIRLSYMLGFFFFFLFFNSFYFLGEVENYIIFYLNSIDLYENYYEALNNTNMNDFMLLFISYYSINSFEFILIGVLLLVGSIVCVNLNKSNKFLKVQKYSNFFNIFNIFSDYISFFFMRKQNLHDQANFKPSLRVFKKKNK